MLDSFVCLYMPSSYLCHPDATNACVRVIEEENLTVPGSMIQVASTKAADVFFTSLLLVLKFESSQQQKLESFIACASAP